MATRLPARIQTFVMFDLEGTGLPSQPADYPVRIMELSMVAVQRAAAGSPPQVQRQRIRAGEEVVHLPPAERGLTTPKRPRQQDGLRERALTPAQSRPRLSSACSTPPPSSSDGSDEEEGRDPTPVPVPTPPRVRNSLLLTVSPRKPISAVVTDITDLDNEQLEPHSTFDRELAALLGAYLNRLPAPVCLVAHNGGKYDFPLLKAELLHVDPTWLDSSELLCADSLAFFRAAASGGDRTAPAPAGDAAAVYALDATTLSCGHAAADDWCIVCNPSMWLSFGDCDTNADFEFTRVGDRRTIRCFHGEGRRCVVCENVPHYRRPSPRARRQLFAGPRAGGGGGGRAASMTLPEVYRRRFGVSPERSHSAADDVEALLLLCLSYGERFFDWADRNCGSLRDVKEMWVRGERRAPVQAVRAHHAPPQPVRAHRVLPVW